MIMRAIVLQLLILAFAVAVVLPNDVGTLDLPAIGVKAATKAHSGSLDGNAVSPIACMMLPGLHLDRIVEALGFEARQIRQTAVNLPVAVRLLI